MTEQERQEMLEVIQEAMDANKPKETDADRRARIMAIKNPVERQREIEKNLDAFSGMIHQGGNI